MVRQLSNQEKWKAWKGLVYYIVLMAIFLGPCSIINYYLGMPGLVISHSILLATAIFVTVLHKTPFKEVFPIKKVSIKDFFGIIIFAVGAILGNLALAGICMLLFPAGKGTVEGDSNFLFGNGLPPVVIVLIISMLPAVTEEAIMRGALLSYLRGLKKTWLICVLVGLAFGILHTSVIKLIPTAFLGGLFAYLVIKKDNILLASIVHFLNNLLASVAGVLAYSTTDSGEVAQQTLHESTIEQFGSFMILGFLVPILLVTGAKLLGITKPTGKKWVIAITCSLVLLIGGMVLTNMG